MEYGNPYLLKYNVLFNKDSSHWCSFKPRVEDVVYPCYACRDMFRCKSSFLDHINRRGLVITYACVNCSKNEVLTFYNPCAFLLHIRKHFSTSGEIDLDAVNISTLPTNLVGLFPHPNVPLLYDVEEDNIGEISELNCRFYSPTQETVGKQIITLTPTVLFFNDTSSPNSPQSQLTLKQLSSNIPHCKFISLDQNSDATDNLLDLELIIKSEPPEETLHTELDLFAMKTENDIDKENFNRKLNSTSGVKNSEALFPKCPECHLKQKSTMTEHFLKKNRPNNENLKCIICKFIAPTYCSLQAHIRLHDSSSPFVCPECGRDFYSSESLLEHLDEVCFHLAKQVRYRCPAKNCGKIFAQTQTYSAHFMLHMICICRCSLCDINFLNHEQFFEHMKTHEVTENSQKLFKCTVCTEQDDTFTEGNYKEHIQWHCTDRTHSVYVYLCKYCRSYFRSTLTYATHLLKCSKKQWLEGTISYKKVIVTVCLKCNYQVKYNANMSLLRCPRCGSDFNSSQPNNSGINLEEEKNVVQETDLEKEMCKLCDAEDHDHLSEKCKYSSPQVVLDKLKPNNYQSNFEDENIINQSNAKENLNEICEIKTDSSPKVEEPQAKKRKKINSTPKSKQMSFYSESEEVDLIPEQPIVFDGTYRCNICNYSDTDRHTFHEHVILHRETSTLYQCMECGECFVVKPSFIKHLKYFHDIESIDQYLEENNCYDKNAVNDLEKSVKYSSVVRSEDTAENQCKVCRLQFNDNLELNKHFRVHGMAFLMENQK